MYSLEYIDIFKDAVPLGFISAKIFQTSKTEKECRGQGHAKHDTTTTVLYCGEFNLDSWWNLI